MMPTDRSSGRWSAGAQLDAAAPLPYVLSRYSRMAEDSKRATPLSGSSR